LDGQPRVRRKHERHYLLEGRLITFSRLKPMLLCTISALALSLFALTASASAATGAISGEVIKVGGSTAIEGVEACAFQLPSYEPVFCEETDVNGEYEISGLPSGEYIVEFWASYLGYAPQFYNGVSSYEDAEEITVGSSTVPGIDAALQKGGAIEGRVTDASTGAGINGALVCAFSRVIEGNCGQTNAAGDYAVIGLATGSYGVEFWAEPLGYPTLFYNQQSNPANANLVSVTAPNATGGINAQMSKPGSKVVVTPAPVLPAPPVTVMHKAKALKCRKGYKKTKRHGRQVCVKKHKKKHHHS
jgi:hypothetical protein